MKTSSKILNSNAKTLPFPAFKKYTGNTTTIFRWNWRTLLKSNNLPPFSNTLLKISNISGFPKFIGAVGFYEPTLTNLVGGLIRVEAVRFWKKTWKDFLDRIEKHRRDQEREAYEALHRRASRTMNWVNFDIDFIGKVKATFAMRSPRLQRLSPATKFFFKTRRSSILRAKWVLGRIFCYHWRPDFVSPHYVGWLRLKRRQRTREVLLKRWRRACRHADRTGQRRPRRGRIPAEAVTPIWRNYRGSRMPRWVYQIRLRQRTKAYHHFFFHYRLLSRNLKSGRYVAEKNRFFQSCFGKNFLNYLKKRQKWLKFFHSFRFPSRRFKQFIFGASRLFPSIKFFATLPLRRFWSQLFLGFNSTDNFLGELRHLFYDKRLYTFHNFLHAYCRPYNFDTKALALYYPLGDLRFSFLASRFSSLSKDSSDLYPSKGSLSMLKSSKSSGLVDVSNFLQGRLPLLSWPFSENRSLVQQLPSFFFRVADAPLISALNFGFLDLGTLSATFSSLLFQPYPFFLRSASAQRFLFNTLISKLSGFRLLGRLSYLRRAANTFVFLILFCRLQGALLRFYIPPLWMLFETLAFSGAQEGPGLRPAFWSLFRPSVVFSNPFYKTVSSWTNWLAHYSNLAYSGYNGPLFLFRSRKPYPLSHTWMSLQGPFDRPLYSYSYYPITFGGQKFRCKDGALPFGFFPAFFSLQRLRAILTSFVTVTNSTFFRSKKRFTRIPFFSYRNYLGNRSILTAAKPISKIKFSSLIGPASIVCHGTPFSFFRFKFYDCGPLSFYPKEAFNFFLSSRSPRSRTRFLTRHSKFYPWPLPKATKYAK
jgi:hypothetical protein